MKKKLVLFISMLLVLGTLVNGIVFTSAGSASNITIEYDKANAAVGEIMKVSVKVNDIKNLMGFQVNIQYDPEVLQPVNPEDGTLYDASTNPLYGNILNNSEYTIMPLATNDLKAGTINFGRSYIAAEAYKNKGKPDTTGTIAIIGFKVLKNAPVEIKFQDSVNMPDAATGTLLFDWDGSPIASSEYSVIQPTLFNIPPDIKGYWAEDNIIELMKKGIVSGYEDGTVKPKANITRAEITTLIIKAVGLEESKEPKLTFADNDQIKGWVRGYLQTAVDQKIIAGYKEDNTFRPARNLTRMEMVAMTMRAFKYEDGDIASLDFTDNDDIAWAKGPVAKAKELGIVGGYKDGTFMPKNNITRAEAFTIIAKCLELKAK